MIFRCYFDRLGAHVRCKFFSGNTDGALGQNGVLTFRVDEFEQFKNSAPFIQFRDVERDWKNDLRPSEQIIREQRDNWY